MRSLFAVFICLLLGVLGGCESETAPSSYVARVGDHYLHQDDLERKLAGMGPVPDSTQARQQVINQWVENILLLREAKRLNLEEDPDVKRQLEEQRRNTLVTAVTNRIYDEMNKAPSDEEVRTYFERHQDEMTLREPYARVRHLATSNRDSAQAVRRTLVSTREAEMDSVWARLSRSHADRPRRALRMALQFLPTSRLFTQLPYVQDELSALEEGQVSRVIQDNNRYHVLQLVRRVEKGADPELRWVEDEIRRRLEIRHRKQMYAREVQRLRNRAKANNLIETPSPSGPTDQRSAR